LVDVFKMKNAVAVLDAVESTASLPEGAIAIACG
jgi:hypothetical protein